jgi:hypothetical protein
MSTENMKGWWMYIVYVCENRTVKLVEIVLRRLGSRMSE